MPLYRDVLYENYSASFGASKDLIHAKDISEHLDKQQSMDFLAVTRAALRHGGQTSGAVDLFSVDSDLYAVARKRSPDSDGKPLPFPR